MVDTHAISTEASAPTVAEFPIIIDGPRPDQLCISFQVREAPARFRLHERRGEHIDNDGEQSRGELFGQYRNVQIAEGCMATLGLKLVSVYVRNKPTLKGLRKVVYFWFAQQSDPREFRDPAFLAYAMEAFQVLSSNVYAEGESYVNHYGPACITLKGIAQCAPKMILSLCEGEIELIEVPA